jgi:CheY-like chemotaxis protein
LLDATGVVFLSFLPSGNMPTGSVPVQNSSASRIPIKDRPTLVVLQVAWPAVDVLVVAFILKGLDRTCLSVRMDTHMQGHVVGKWRWMVIGACPDPKAPADSTLARVQAEASKASRTILLVEDESFVREVTCEVLQYAGYRVFKAANALEALRLFRRYGKEVQLVITDVVMPGKNGHALASDLWAIRPDLRAILTSGYPENVGARPAFPKHGACFLSKPFSVESLLLKVRQVLESGDIPAAARTAQARRR